MKKRQTIMRTVARTRRAWNNHVRQIALAEGIPDSYRPVLMYLHREPGASQREVAEFAEVTTSAINQVVSSMLKENYLRKETDPSDKRNTRLYLTEKGEQVAGKLRGRLGESDDAITAFLGEERETELIELLESLAEYVREELGRC